jgi:hypothetical protein
MGAGGILATLAAAVTWPASRFAGSRRTYDLSIPPAHACAVIRGGVAVDPLFRPFGEGNAQSATPEVVGRIWEKRFEIYISGKFASGIGLIGTVEDTSLGSQVTTKVGWTGPTKWVWPGLTVLLMVAVIASAGDVPAAISTGSVDWLTVGFGVMCAVLQMANLMTCERRARHHDLPMIFEQLERVLSPYRR